MLHIFIMLVAALSFGVWMSSPSAGLFMWCATCVVEHWIDKLSAYEELEDFREDRSIP